MKTITALEFRKNMGNILTRVNAGEEFLITYRNSEPIRLLAERKMNKLNKNPVGLDALNSAPRKNFKYDDKKSFKQLYDESLTGKYSA